MPHNWPYRKFPSKCFGQVELYGDWARRQDRDRTGSGIDLVATRHDGGLAAIRCKFFEATRKIMKGDIDSFFSASGKPETCERMVVETTNVPWSQPAETMLHGQLIPTIRIGLVNAHMRLLSTQEWLGCGLHPHDASSPGS